MLSIGLGQEQQFTCILQTMAQLTAVYGSDVDKILQGNINNIVYLKSTDDQMINTLSTMSGEREEVKRGSRSVTRNNSKILNKNDATVTYTDSAEKKATLTYNDFAFIGKCQSIVFRAGDMPMWNRNEMLLPMSFALFGGKAEKTIRHYGHTYSLQTVPTLSEAAGFDIRLNQPDFRAMYNKRMDKGWSADQARRLYMDAYGYDEFSIQMVDPNVVSREIMEIIDTMERERSEAQTLPKGADVETGGATAGEDGRPDGTMLQEPGVRSVDPNEGMIDNKEFHDDTARAAREQKEREIRLYAGRRLSKDSLVSKTGVSHQLDELIVDSYVASRVWFEKDNTFSIRDGSLYLRRNDELLIELTGASENFEKLRSAAEDPESRVFMAGDEKDELHGEFKVTDAMHKFLVSMDAWVFAEGHFESEMSARMGRLEDDKLA